MYELYIHYNYYIRLLSCLQFMFTIINHLHPMTVPNGLTNKCTSTHIILPVYKTEVKQKTSIMIIRVLHLLKCGLICYILTY